MTNLGHGLDHNVVNMRTNPFCPKKELLFGGPMRKAPTRWDLGEIGVSSLTSFTRGEAVFRI